MVHRFIRLALVLLLFGVGVISVAAPGAHVALGGAGLMDAIQIYGASVGIAAANRIFFSAADGSLTTNSRLTLTAAATGTAVFFEVTGETVDGLSTVLRLRNQASSSIPALTVEGQNLSNDVTIATNGTIVTNPFGGYANPAGLDGGIVITNSSAPTANITNGIALFAVAVAGSHELQARDEAGNVATLTPHNFTLFTPDTSYFYPWSYYARHNARGKEINVDMYGAIKAIERLSGERFIYERSFAPTE